jgi:FkbM family methyltransferase
MLKIKVLIAKALCSDIFGRLIGKIYSERIPFHGSYIFTHYPLIKNYIKASLFWKLYESAEIHFIRKHIDDSYDVIELGGSIGVVSVQIGKKLKSKKLYIIEANPFLIQIIKKNIDENKIENYRIINCALNTEHGTSVFLPGDKNTTGKISTSENQNGINVESKSLSNIIEENGIGPFVLVCDIEGSEADLLINNSVSLKNCQKIIIETHSTTFNGVNYSPESLKQLILKSGFKLIDQHGVNFVFEK